MAAVFLQGIFFFSWKRHVYVQLGMRRLLLKRLRRCRFTSGKQIILLLCCFDWRVIVLNDLVKFKDVLLNTGKSLGLVAERDLLLNNF